MKRMLCIWLPDWSSRRMPRLDVLAAHCERFSPTVGVESSADPESLLLDITGLAHLFGGEAALARQIVDDFARRGLSVRVAIADTLGAAWAVAHCCRVRETHHSLSYVVRFTHPTVVPPGEAAAALRPLPIELLRLNEEMVALLHQLGIEEIGQLEMLPRGELATRLGAQVLQRLDQAVGRLDEPIVPCQPTPLFRAHWAFEHPTGRRETIEQVLEHLVAQVAAMLIRRGRGALRLECRLDCRPENPVRVGVGLFEPTAKVKHLFQLVELQLERLRIPAPVTAIHVEAAITAPLEYRQQELFADEPARQRPRQLAALVDRLTSRLTERAVARVRLKSDAQPELAWQCEPLVNRASSLTHRNCRVPRAACLPVSPARADKLPVAPNTTSYVYQTARGRRAGRQETPADLLPRPLRLLPRPQRLATTLVLPSGPPVRFQHGGQEHHVAHTWGPERIETGWWRGQNVGRDYFCVETTTGRRFWLFRRLRDGQWFLHGMFE